MHGETGQGPGDRRSRGLARWAGALHGHRRVAAALRMTADFFAADLPMGVKRVNQLGTEVPSPEGVKSAGQPGTESPSPEERAPLERLVTVLQDAMTILAAEPKLGRCHYLDLQLELPLAVAHGRPVTGSVRLIRGTAGEIRLPGQIARGRRVRPRPGAFSLDARRMKRRCWPARRTPSRITTCCTTSSRGI